MQIPAAGFKVGCGGYLYTFGDLACLYAILSHDDKHMVSGFGIK